MEPGSLPPSPLHGFDSDGGAVSAQPGRRPADTAAQRAQLPRARLGATRTRNSVSESGEELAPESLPTPTRRRHFRPRAGTDPLAAVPEHGPLESRESLDWDRFGEYEPLQTASGLDNTRRWSTDTLFSVPVAGGSSVAGDDERSSSSGEESYLSPEGDNPPRAENRLEAPAARTGGMEPDEAARRRRKVAQSILEAEEDVLPYTSKRVSLNCLTRLCILATSLKKDLQAAHLDLSADEEYVANLQEVATACRQKLTLFLVDADVTRVQLEEEEERKRQQQSAAAAGPAERLPIVVRRLQAATDDLARIKTSYVAVVDENPGEDEALLERVEKMRLLDERFVRAAADTKENLKLALEHNLFKEEERLDNALTAAKEAKERAGKRLLDWRKSAGVWGEKKTRPSAHRP